MTLLAVTGLAALCSGGLPAGAQSVDEARQQREATLQERAAAAEQLQVLSAQESELRAALAVLDEALAFQTSKLAAAQQARTVAEVTSAQRQAELVETGERVVLVRQQAANAVVRAYIGATGGDHELLEAADANEYVQRQHLLGMVDGNYEDALDLLRALLEDQEGLRVAADAAVVESARLADEIGVVQAELQLQRDTQSRVEGELRTRIVDFEGKVAQLDAAEAELAAVIGRASASSSSSSASSSAADEAAPSAPRLGPTSGGSGYLYPADGGISSGFGYRRHPILGTSRLHAGIDIGASYGTDVWASKGGVVILAGWNGGYGNCVMIDHGDGVVTLYGHMSALFVSEGESVQQGTVIGLVGSTGMSTGPHLHFETHVGGQPEDPLNYVG